MHRKSQKIVLNLIITIWSLAVVCGTPVNNPLFTSANGKEVFRRSKAADIKSWMDLNEDPCNNFYQFACGKWQRINSAQLFGEYTTDKFQDITKGIQHKVNKLLQEPKTGDVFEDKLRDFYESCKATKRNEQGYKEELKKIYSEFGNFSFEKTEENHSTFNWWKTLAKINRIFGKSFIINVDVLEDVNDKNRTMVYIGTPEFSLTQAKNILQSLHEAKIYVYLQKYFDVEADRARQVARNLLDFERRLSAGATDVREGKSVTELLSLYNTTDLNDKFIDLFDFEIFLTLTLNTTELPDQIYIYDQLYLLNVINVLNTTDLSTLEDYILWLLIEESIVDAKNEHINKWCSEKSKKYFGKFIDFIIYKQYRSEEYEQDIYALWEEIKAIFRENLEGEHYYWMSNGTRVHAIEKLDKMTLTINSYENENFHRFFQNLTIDPFNYVGNIFEIQRHTESLRTNKLSIKPDSIDNAQVLSFTPVYNSFENSITIPVSLLQPYRVWHPEYPTAIKYATLGFLLAHEMIHGFDDQGRNYDANGHTNNWWDEMSSYEFESRRRCFQAQYHNYTYGGRHLPESISQPENIADNAGVKIAYLAYKNWLAREKTMRSNVEADDTLPNLAYNNHELFFISYAQMWCEDVQILFQHFLAKNDIHAPAMYRVIGSLSNFNLFAWIFRCDMKPETPMNPSIKCELY